MIEWGLNFYWQNLLTRLVSAERRGVQFALTEDAEDLSIRIPKRITDTDFRAGLRNDKEALLEAVRLREGLCVCCGMDKPRHPLRKGVATTFLWGSLTSVEGDCSSLLVCPIYCTSCWESRSMWRGIVEKRRAYCQEEREKAALRAREAPLRREAQTATDFGGDSGGSSLEALAFRAH